MKTKTIISKSDLNLINGGEGKEITVDISKVPNTGTTAITPSFPVSETVSVGPSVYVGPEGNVNGGGVGFTWTFR